MLVVLILIATGILTPVLNVFAEGSILYYIECREGDWYAIYSPSVNYRPFYYSGGNIVFVAAYRWAANPDYIVFQAPVNKIYLRPEAVNYSVITLFSAPNKIVTVRENFTGNTVNITFTPRIVYSGGKLVAIYSGQQSAKIHFGAPRHGAAEVTVALEAQGALIRIEQVNGGSNGTVIWVVTRVTNGYYADRYKLEIIGTTVKLLLEQTTIDAPSAVGLYCNNIAFSVEVNEQKLVLATEHDGVLSYGGVTLHIINSISECNKKFISSSYDYWLYAQTLNITFWTSNEARYPIVIPIDTVNISNIIKNPNPLLYIPKLGLYAPAEVINYGSKHSFLLVYNPHINPCNVTTLSLENITITKGVTIMPHLFDLYGFKGCTSKGYVVHQPFTVGVEFEMQYINDTGANIIFAWGRWGGLYPHAWFYINSWGRSDRRIVFDVGVGDKIYETYTQTSFAREREWYYVTGTCNKTYIILYVNGTKINSKQANFTFTRNPREPISVPFMVYQARGKTLVSFAFLYNRTLNQTEIKEIAHHIVNATGLQALLDADCIKLSGDEKIPAAQTWLWVIYNSTDDGLVHLKWFPRGSVVSFYNASGRLVLSVGINSNDVAVSLPEGRYNVVARVPLSSLSFPAEIIWNYPIRIEKPPLRYNYYELGDILSAFPFSGSAEVRDIPLYDENGTVIGHTTRLVVNGTISLHDYVGATLILDIDGNYTAYGVDTDTIGSSEDSYTVMYVLTPDARITGNFTLGRVLVLWNTRVHTHYFVNIMGKPELRSFELYRIRIASGTVTGTWSYRVPIYIALSELPERLDETGFIFRIVLPTSRWVSAGLLSPALEDLLIVDSSMRPLPFFIYGFDKDNNAIVYVRYDEPIMSNTIVLYVLLQNKNLWGTGNSFSSLTATFDAVNPVEFTDDFGFKDTYTYMTYNMLLFKPTSSDWAVKIGKTWYDFVAVNSKGELWVQHGSLVTFAKNLTLKKPVKEIMLYISRDHDNVLFYVNGRPWFAIKLSEFNASKAYYIGYRNCIVYAGRTLLYSYSIGSIVGGMQRPTVTVSQPPPPPQQTSPRNTWKTIIGMIPLLLLAVVIRLIREPRAPRPRGGELPW